ncbi:DNA starvation/stationary phase protection protein [Luteimonas sp. MC1750]|nr:DNA starvation/stationary phase protection protein [Luteimonas sp. MC1750]QQO05377.1 DNA starvation/stationary phase protection protein [Luteimonas sp. MC1750]
MAKTKSNPKTAAKPKKGSASNPKEAMPAASPARTSMAPGVDIGISDRDRKAISQDLGQFLSDSFTLYLKTHNFHWNVTGPMFNSLHAMFMEQYTEQWNALDETAERIRALGYNAPGSYAEFIRLSSITEEPGLTEAPDWRDMVRQLVEGNEAVCRTARRALSNADDAGDDPTVDLLTQRLHVHEKNAWMLRSLLQ